MRVCVVGAGPCGITTIKQLLDEAHEVVCYEKNSDLGGIWQRDGDDGSKTKAFDNLLLTISMRLMAYSDFPFKGGRKFYTRQQYFDYLTDYATYFGLRDSIRFDSEVSDIKQTSQGYVVTTLLSHGIESRETFDAVAVSSGPFKTPNREIPELAGFTGEIVHSAEYRNAERFRGLRVLVLGLAESGADIVREVGDVAAATTLAIRSYSYLLPRVVDDHRSTDSTTTRSHHYEMYDRATKRALPYQTFWGRSRLAKTAFGVMSVALGLTSAVGEDLRNLRDWIRPGRRHMQPLNPMGEAIDPPKMDLGTVDNDSNRQFIAEWNKEALQGGKWSPRRIFCKNVTFVPSIVSGKVVLNDTGLARAENATVYFKDGTSAEYDAVVLCTGYHRDLVVGDLSVEDGNVRNLYKHFLHPRHDGKVAFIGFVRPFNGGIPICAEMQARYFARVLSGKLQPSPNLHEVIAEEKAWEEHWTALSPRHTESHHSVVLYLDALAREIGCLLPMRSLMVSPRLFVQVWFGSFNPSAYRIAGPHNLGEAALTDLYSEPVENRAFAARMMSILRFLPSWVHP